MNPTPTTPTPGLMIDLLDRKIRQMHEALGSLAAGDLSSIKPERSLTQNHFYCMIDFSAGKSDAELSNMATLLVANIACLKDHLKVWCQTNNKAFEGDKIIDSDRCVALVHDLWNIDKHAELTRPPRSGHHPRIRGLRQTLNLITGTTTGSGAMITFDPYTGQMTTRTLGGASVKLVVSGEVVDAGGNLLGDLAEICEKATTAWEQALTQAGVPIPTR